MTQLAPTTLQYGQLMALINEFTIDYRNGLFKNPDDVIQKVKDIMTQFNNIGGQPLLDFESFALGEPPTSDKMNRIWRMLENDVNLMQDQVQILKAAVIFLYNFTATEIQLAKNQNATATNKLKTLQLYSTSQDNNIIQFGDFFSNLDFVDLTLTPDNLKVSHLGAGTVSLGRTNTTLNNSGDLNVTILSTSNGFIGNNQEITDPSLAITNGLTNSAIYSFKAELETRHSDLTNITDGIPTTWFEYESNLVSNADRLKAKDLNFVYRSSTDTTASSTADTGTATDISNTMAQQGLVDWAIGPSGGVLKLDLEFDLKTAKTINTISYTPFGLENNKNAPIKIKLVQTSPDGTNWSSVSPENLWVALDANLQTARVAENVVIGTAIYVFDERIVRYVRMSIEQAQSIDSNIGHLYYETNQTVQVGFVEVANDTPPPATKQVQTNTIVGGDRTLGPIPPITEPDKYYKQNGLLIGNLIQNTEYFQGKRWAIGIRDILIQESKYSLTSTMISKIFRISGVVDRVSLESDIFIPSNFPSDTGKLWIRFYVSPNNGLNWYPISRVQDDYLGIPEIIAFNDPLPAEFRESGIQYINTNSVVNALRVKIELSRPDNLTSSSPILRSYKLKVLKR